MKSSQTPRDGKLGGWLRFLGEALGGGWAVILLCFSGYILHFNSAPVGFLCLLVVVAEAIICGFWQATVVSVIGAACLDFLFYPPYLTLNITDPQDWVALGAFELSALVVSRVSSREQRSTHEAGVQRMAMEQLYELSRSTLMINLHQPAGPQLSQVIRTIFSVEGVAIFDANSGKCDIAGSLGEGEENTAKECYFLQENGDDPVTGISVRVLRTRNTSVGAIAIRGTLGPLVTDALASLAAITLDRCVSFEKEIQIEQAHQSERLRAAVLDSLAHAVKTPLTAIQTASSGLREVGPLNESQGQLVSLVENETNKLSQLCTRLLQTAKLEAEDLTLQKDEIEVSDLVGRVLREQSGRMAGHPIEVVFANTSLKVRGDSELLSMALAQFLDNAAKYSFAGQKVKVSAWESHAEVTISVHNFGPPIPISEREKIFQRFYRGKGSKAMAEGTGVGLSTVKMAAEAHRGHTWVISDAEEGTTFFLSLPGDGRRTE
ncbi:MAG TPA: ATP-binding protein [Terracidiphilus sp.]|jgi:two-component system sensor histidine kinase KdpD|nr:ATP-binding protein [Terracidiphilus sp.]